MSNVLQKINQQHLSKENYREYLSFIPKKKIPNTACIILREIIGDIRILKVRVQFWKFGPVLTAYPAYT